jgi:hypothetical protein
MPVPTSFTDISTTAADNSPAGGESPKGVVDDYLRQGFAFNKTLYNALKDSSYLWLDTVAGTDMITATASPAVTAYAAGQTYRFKSAGANTGAVTLNLNSVGAKAITKNGTTALAAGDIPSGAVCEVVYDGSQFQLVNAGFVGLGGSAVAARSAIGVAPMSAVKGLTGNVNATTPLTKYDLSATAVILQDANGATVLRSNIGTLTCDLGLAGSVANGRDQAGVFTANSWIYQYFIWNGTTLATLASTTAPASFTGSTLPSGYTHWAFATAIRWNASSNIVPCYARGGTVFYDVAAGAGSAVRALTSGQATSLTAVSLGSQVPPNVLMVHLNFLVNVTHSVAGVDFSALFRPTGSSNAGTYAVLTMSQVASVQHLNSNSVTTPVGTSQQIDYKISTVPSSSGGVSIDVLSFTVPNGDA